MHLERCIRIMPQDNDTGGFFVAVLRRGGITEATVAAAKAAKEALGLEQVEGKAAVDTLKRIGYCPTPPPSLHPGAAAPLSVASPRSVFAGQFV